MLRDSNAFSGFSVDDLSKAKSFYGDILGLFVKDNPMGLLELHLKGSNPVIIYPKPDHTPATFTILNFPVTDIESTVDKLIDKNIIFEQYKGDIATNEKGICRNENGPAIAWFKDPSGNILSLIEKD